MAGPAAAACRFVSVDDPSFAVPPDGGENRAVADALHGQDNKTFLTWGVDLLAETCDGAASGGPSPPARSDGGSRRIEAT